jgi:Ca2+-binding RTX toxin-like protein
VGGNDTLRGEDGADTIDGGLGLDTIYGGTGADTIYGRDGADYLWGSTSDYASDFISDSVFGGNGNDILVGIDESSDFLRGEAGDDTIAVNNDDAAGGPGNDILESFFNQGGRMTGGTGSDRFVIFNRQSEVSNTVITDFNDQDSVRVEYDGVKSYYYGATLFSMLDTNRDSLLTGSDGFTTPDGTIGVSQSAGALTIFLGVDSIRFENIASIASADWV